MDFERRMKRKIAWDNRGVSEVIGTILTMSITVVLFSSIILMVGRFPAPGSNAFVTLSGTVDPQNDWADGAYINLTNTGGITLTSLFTQIYMKIDGTSYSLETRGVDSGMPYGLIGTNVDWEVGDTWSIKIPAGDISALSKIDVAIIDVNKDTVVWTHELFGGGQSLSPVVIEGWVDSDTKTPRQDPIRFNHPFTFFVKIMDPNNDLDPNSVYVDMSDIGLSSSKLMIDDDNDGTFVNVSMMGGHITVGYYKFIVYVSDMSGNKISSTITVPLGQDIGNVVNLAVLNDTMLFSIDNPKHGDIVTISAVIRNTGLDYSWVDVYFYDGNMSTAPIGHNEILISGVDSQTAFIDWRAAPGGIHQIYVEAVVRAPKEDFDPTDNFNWTKLSVLPTILLVDDDNHDNDRSDADTVSFMRSSLESGSFQYDYLKVGQNLNGPGYNYGSYRLQNYDIVIWMTGYESTSTLTMDDQANLKRYLTDTSNDRNNTGSLWLIGNNWLEDPNLDEAFSNSTFLRDYLHIDSSAAIVSPGNTMAGLNSHIISKEWTTTGSSKPFDIIKRDGGDDTLYNITRAPVATGYVEDMLVVGNDTTAINYENNILDERIVVFPWEFSRIDDPSIQTQMAFKVIRWLGGIDETLGKDLAISSQKMSLSYIFYQQEVMISATVRNNGEEALTGVKVLMFVDGEAQPDSERIISLEGDGGSRRVFFNWTANVVGPHTIKWKVDPLDIIHETNENNNEVSDYLTTGELIVEFRILVVDDDDSSNNGGGEYNETKVIKNIMDDLGYVYENHTVTNTGINGPGAETLDDYSAVIWVTGNASTDTLTLVDEVNIKDYMRNHNGRLWLVGANCLGDSVTPGFEDIVFGIDGINDNEQLPEILNGVEDDPITHGMEIQISDGDGADADTITTGTGANGFLADGNEYYGIRYYSNVSSSFSAVMTMSFMNIAGNTPGYISGSNARSELLYMIFHWFQKPDMRTELRITNTDLSVSDQNPVLGDAYILQATVHNAGYVEGNALIRFMDGNTQIGSDSISISPDDTTTAEVIWRPLFAGNRNITVMVDPFIPVSEVPEIFEWFNNNITMPIYVYFFWDDMEDTASSLNKWNHYSTIVNINGENPIDYFTTTTNMDTDVISNWDATASYGVDVVTDEFHTYDTSFFMEEPTGAFGEKADVLVGIVIDNSPSMVNRFCPDGSGRTYLRVAMDAAIGMVNEFTDESAVGVYIFKGANEEQLIQITDLAGNGRQTVIDKINTIKTEQGNTNTAIWDAIGFQYDEVWLAKALPKYEKHYAAVVSLGDGADYQASDDSAYKLQSIESGSDVWAPWGDMDAEGGYPTQNYPNHQGKYWFFEDELPGIWETAGSGAYKPNRKGLINSNVPIYTIGLALEHYDTPYESALPAFPGDGTQDTNTHVFDTDFTESGTVEYNFWRIANTSEAEYFYSEDGSDLEDIFTQIGQIIGATGFNQTRAVDDENIDKRAVTETFSLTDMESAQLSFWHKYNLIQGGNGGFLEVAYKDDAVDGNGDGDPTNDWDFKYVVPPGQYSGGLYYNYNVSDDFNTTIKWCWNGISGGGAFTWDYVNVDILSYIPVGYRDEVRIVFNYTQWGGGMGEGWWIDDVQLKVSRSDSVSPIDHKDVWDLVNMTAMGNTSHSGDFCWSNMDPTTGFMMSGIDNSLQTMPIDLTGAKSAYLSAYVKFNINTDDGYPPDGFRVEISNNGGMTWDAINQGYRTASGTMDWTSIGDLTEINVDLTSWRGYQIVIRFRVCTNTDPGYAHYADASSDGGFYVDDVQVKGESIHGG